MLDLLLGHSNTNWYIKPPARIATRPFNDQLETQTDWKLLATTARFAIRSFKIPTGKSNQDRSFNW